LPAGRLGVAAAQAGLWRVQPLIAKETPGGDVGDREGAAKNATYPVLSVKGLVQLVALQEVVRPMLHDVTVPICTFHGARDHTIAPRSSTEVARRVHGRVVHHVLRQTQHLVALDVERDFVFQETLDFVDDVLAECVA
jgi:esterase/lipase